jgi:hypothetical protein
LFDDLWNFISDDGIPVNLWRFGPMANCVTNNTVDSNFKNALSFMRKTDLKTMFSLKIQLSLCTPPPPH